MPQAVLAVGKFLIGKAALTIGGLTIGAKVGLFLGTTLLSVVSSKLFGPKVPKATGISAQSVMTRSALEYRKIVYGEAMVSGPIVYNNLSGTNGEFLWFVIALADGESEDLVAVYFDGDQIPKADIAWTAGTGGADGTGTGNVSTAKWVGENSTPGAQLYYYLGDPAQPVSGNLNSAFGDITTNHRLREVTYLIAKLRYDEDTEEVWQQGPPQNIKALIKGRKLYDPRLDSTVVIDSTTSPDTFGSGAHRYSNTATWAWSDNPALCVAHYLIDVMGVDPATSVNWETVAKAADDCDALVDVPPAASPANTEKRFTCNGVISLGNTHKDNLDSLLSAMDGRLAYSGGQWRLRASVWEASSVSIDRSDLDGGVEVRGSAPRSERFNTVRGFFIDPTRNYEAVEFPHVTDAAYVTRDNGETIAFDLELPMTNSETMAQRIAFRNLKQGNNQIVVTFNMNARGANVQVGDVVTLDLPELNWVSGETFRVVDWSLNNDGSFKITAREDVAAAYTDPLVGDYGTANTGGITVPSDVLPPPSGLSATAIAGGILLQWTNPPLELYDFIDIYADTDSNWTGAAVVASVGAGTTRYVVPLDGGEQRWFWLRAVRAPALLSLREPNSDTSTVQATALTADGLNAATLTAYKRSASAPTDDPGTLTYTFATAAWTPGNGWSKTIPAGADPCYAVSASAVSADPTDQVDATDWSSPTLILQDGADGDPGAPGDDGLNVATVYIYQRTATNSAPAVPSVTATYTFATGGITGLNNGWAGTVPAYDGSNPYLWVTIATASNTAATDGILTSEWQTPELLSETPEITVPDFTPGQVGGASDFVYSLNTDVSGGAADGEIQVKGSLFRKPDGTLITTDADPFEIRTGYEQGQKYGRFYLMFSATVAETRFGGTADRWGIGDDTRFITVLWNGTAWKAIDNLRNEFPITIASTDVIFAVVENLSSNGLEKLIPLHTGFGVNIGNVSDFTVEPAGTETQYGGFRVDSDGDIYRRQGVAASTYTSIQTWIGNASNTEYQCMVSKPNFVDDDPDSVNAGLGVWLDCSTDRTWEWVASSALDDEFAEVILKFKRKSDNLILATLNIRIDVEFL